jgi:hypothetical protein
MKPVLLAGLALLAACAGPKPCTRTLCVTKLDGTMELAGWKKTVRVAPENPKPPVMSDATVTMIQGTAEFVNGKTKVAASEGSSFKFVVSTRAVSTIEVSSGSVVVSLSTGAPVTLVPGAPFALPKP